MNGFAQQRGFVCSTGSAFEVNTQSQRGVTRQIARPLDNELLRTRIEVALTEGGRVDRVEELPEFGDANFNELRTGNEYVAGRSGRDRFLARRAAPVQPHEIVPPESIVNVLVPQQMPDERQYAAIGSARLDHTSMVDNQAIVIPETIDAIRASPGVVTDATESIAMTNAALGIAPTLADAPPEVTRTEARAAR